MSESRHVCLEGIQGNSSRNFWLSAEPDQIAYISGLGPVIQSIISLTGSLRGPLIKCFTTF